MKNEKGAVKNPHGTSSKSVDVFDSSFYILNKQMLCFYGQWPYQSQLERRIRGTIILLFSFGMMGPQVGQINDSMITISKNFRQSRCSSLVIFHVSQHTELFLVIETLLIALRHGRRCCHGVDWTISPRVSQPS